MVVVLLCVIQHKIVPAQTLKYMYNYILLCNCEEIPNSNALDAFLSKCSFNAMFLLINLFLHTDKWCWFYLRFSMLVLRPRECSKS